MIDNFFADQKDFDEPKKRYQNKHYFSKEELKQAYEAVIDIIGNLSDEDFTPYAIPTQTFLESIWIGLTYRKLILHKEINTEKLSEYIKSWRQMIGDEEFSNLFQARRTSSVKSAFERVKAGIEFFSGEF